MNSRFLFYRLSFIMNMIMLLLFAGLFIYILSKPGTSDPPAYVLPIFFFTILLYLINDMAGLSLVKRIRQNRDISWQVMTRLTVTLFIQFILQLLLAYGLLGFIKTLYSIRYYSAGFFTKSNMLPVTMVMTLFIIFFGSCINIFATLRLIKLAKKNHREAREMVENLGSGN